MLTDKQREWQAKARAFAEEEIRPISLERDAIRDPSATFDWDIVRRGSELGFRTAPVPTVWGGHGIDKVTQVLVLMELARGDSAICKTFSHCWKWSLLILQRCNEEQVARFIPAFVADHEFLLGSASTEPQSGSDNRTLPDHVDAGWQLSAVPDGDDWVLNGTKRYIANGNVAKLLFVATRTDSTVKAAEGGTTFLVPTDTPGLKVGKIYDKVGWRFYQNAELIFQDVRVPSRNMVGEVNGSSKVRRGGAGLEINPLELAAIAVGVCDAANEMALEHARTRWQGGKYIIDHQGIQLHLSEMHKLTEALRSFVLQIAMETDAAGGVSRLDSLKTSLAMNFATDVIQRVTHLNMDIHGGAGVMRDVGAEKLVRDSLIWTHLAGDTVQRCKPVKFLRMAQPTMSAAST